MSTAISVKVCQICGRTKVVREFACKKCVSDVISKFYDYKYGEDVLESPRFWNKLVRNFGKSVE